MSQSNSGHKKRYPFKRQIKRKLRKTIFIIVVGFIVATLNYISSNKDLSPENKNTDLLVDKNKQATATDNNSANIIRQAYLKRKSGLWITTPGTVIKRLKDDREGSQHQRFLIRVAPDITLLVSHNIDLAPRVPLQRGDTIQLRGVYEWNNKGGLLHWTHHDPGGKKKGGWIKLNGRVYR